MIELLYSLTAWVAEYESDRRSERTLAGLARARDQAGVKLRSRGEGIRAQRKLGELLGFTMDKNPSTRGVCRGVFKRLQKRL